MARRPKHSRCSRSASTRSSARRAGPAAPRASSARATHRRLHPRVRGGGALLDASGDSIVGSAWLKTVGADYGLKSATHAKKVTLTQTAAATVKDADVQALVASKIQDGTLPSGNQALYLVYYPPGTVVQSPFGG